jgi:hypothetical protein
MDTTCTVFFSDSQFSMVVKPSERDQFALFVAKTLIPGEGLSHLSGYWAATIWRTL